MKCEQIQRDDLVMRCMLHVVKCEQIQRDDLVMRYMLHVVKCEQIQRDDLVMRCMLHVVNRLAPLQLEPGWHHCCRNQHLHKQQTLTRKGS